MRRAVRDRSAAQSTSRGRKERQRRAESAANGVACGAGAPGAPHRRNGRRRQQRSRHGGAMTAASGEATEAESSAPQGASAATRGPYGTALRPSPRCLGASSAVPASAGPCGPGRGSGATGAAGRGAVRRDSRISPTRRRAARASETLLTAAVEASPAPSRAQRRAGALHGGRLT